MWRLPRAPASRACACSCSRRSWRPWHISAGCSRCMPARWRSMAARCCSPAIRARGSRHLGAAFHDRGYPIVTDDISVIASDAEAHPMIHAGYRQVRLAADSLEHVGASLGARQEMDLGQQRYGPTGAWRPAADAAPHPANVHARAPAGRDDHPAAAHWSRQGHGRRAGHLPATHVGRPRPALRALRAVRCGWPAHRRSSPSSARAISMPCTCLSTCSKTISRAAMGSSIRGLWRRHGPVVEDRRD